MNSKGLTFILSYEIEDYYKYCDQILLMGKSNHKTAL